jgi:hypothetical protein
MRRVAGAAVLALALLGGEARADVFVPEDPPRSSRACANGSGNVVVALRRTSRGRLDVVISEAGGRWRPLFGASLERAAGCPSVVTAVDGTAVVAEGSRLAVRPPGGRFGDPVRVGAGVTISDVAAAPGGWAAAIGVRRATRSAKPGLVAAVVAPDGVARVGVLDDARASGPSIGIDATGATTAAWVRMTDTTEIRAARATGGAWEPPRALGVRPYLDDQAPDVAVSPAGRVLLAWAEQDGIRASLDGSAPQTLAAEPNTVAPSAAVNDAGAAVVAYAADGLRASSRAADGPWASLSVLPAEGAYPEVVVAPDGRAVIGWRESAADGTGAFATWGHSGGAWAPPTRLSSPTRPAETPQMWIGADGAPRLAWVEDLSDPRHTRLRGARLTPDAEAGPPDTVAPVLATRLPQRTPRTRTARLRIGIPVRCSEACDVRVRLLHGVDEVLASVARAVTANRRVILPLRIRADIALLLLADRTARRPRLEVLASDRVGNLARASGRLRIRIDDPPLLDFLVGPRHDFAMFSAVGNRAVGRLVNALITGLASGAIDSRRALRRRFERGADAIEAAGHDEIWDTAVLDEIFDALYVPARRKGIAIGPVLAE